MALILVKTMSFDVTNVMNMLLEPEKINAVVWDRVCHAGFLRADYSQEQLPE